MIDEATIDGSPQIVFGALMDEFLGVSGWWKPHLEFKIRGNEKVVQKGTIMDVTILSRFGKRKVVEKVVEIKTDKLVKIKYLEGDTIGTGKWTFQPYDGKTQVKFHWMGNSNRLLINILSPIINISKHHSEIFHLGFKGLNLYVAQKMQETRNNTKTDRSG